ncbi:MAG: rhomboid family intramembrane serine protease [Bacteroidota bacterium]
MLFPIGDTQVQGGYKPYFSYGFIALNIIIWIIQFTSTFENPYPSYLIPEYGAVPSQIIQGKDYETLFTSMFMHGGWGHILSNMLYMWIFADNIEATIGHFRFVLFYLAGGIAAAYTHILLDTASNIPMVGASGALSAVMGAYLVMFPKSQIKILVIYLFRSFHVSAYIALGIWIAFQLFNGIGGLDFLSGGEGKDSGGVAYWAHIGGFFFGVLMGFVFKSFVDKNDVYTPGSEGKLPKGNFFPT